MKPRQDIGGQFPGSNGGGSGIRSGAAIRRCGHLNWDGREHEPET